MGNYKHYTKEQLIQEREWVQHRMEDFKAEIARLETFKNSYARNARLTTYKNRLAGMQQKLVWIDHYLLPSLFERPDMPKYR